MANPPPSARRHSHRSAQLAREAAAVARQEAGQGQATLQIAGIVTTYQAAAATMAQTDVAEMLSEQAIDEAAEAILNSLAFTTEVANFEAMVEAITERRDLRFSVVNPSRERTQAQFDAEYERLVASLVQDAARAAEVVATAVRPRIAHVRLLSPPSCSRCAVLAGRIYRYSDGFLRHPNCDCVMIPTTVANDQLIQDPVELMRQGLLRGLSKADQQAVADGADLNQVVNVRRLSSSLQQSGRVLARRGRLTPEGIYAAARTREEAVELLAAGGYIL